MASISTKVVSMSEVPDPTSTGGRRGKYGHLYEQLTTLKPGQALQVELPTDKLRLYVRAILRKAAKRDKQFLSSSKSPDGKTGYFWLEKITK